MKIIFVCMGNTCRSVMLKYMFKSYANKNDLIIDSAGLIDHKKPMNINTDIVLELNHIPHKKDNSKFISKDLFDANDLVFVMSKEIKNKLEEFYGKNQKIVGLDEFYGKDIFDPYGLGLDAYKKVYSVFESILPNILDYINNI